MKTCIFYVRGALQETGSCEVQQKPVSCDVPRTQKNTGSARNCCADSAVRVMSELQPCASSFQLSMRVKTKKNEVTRMRATIELARHSNS